MSNRSWGHSAEVGKLYRVTTKSDLARVGSCWMNGRLHIGDVLLCTAHSGDHFYDYLLVEPGGNFVRVLTELSAYSLGTPMQWQPSKREFHLLMAGETIITTSLWEELRQLEQTEMAARAEVIRNLEPGDIVKVSSSALPLALRNEAYALAVVDENLLASTAECLKLAVKGHRFGVNSNMLDFIEKLEA